MAEEKEERCPECGREVCTLENCKVVDKLIEVHYWAHKCLGHLSREELRHAHEVGQRIIKMLNEEPESNPVKFLGMFEVLGVGADMLAIENGIISEPTATIQ